MLQITFKSGEKKLEFVKNWISNSIHGDISLLANSFDMQHLTGENSILGTAIGE